MFKIIWANSSAWLVGYRSYSPATYFSGPPSIHSEKNSSAFSFGPCFQMVGPSRALTCLLLSWVELYFTLTDHKTQCPPVWSCQNQQQNVLCCSISNTAVTQQRFSTESGEKKARVFFLPVFVEVLFFLELSTFFLTYSLFLFFFSSSVFPCSFFGWWVCVATRQDTCLKEIETSEMACC